MHARMHSSIHPGMGMCAQHRGVHAAAARTFSACSAASCAASSARLPGGSRVGGTSGRLASAQYSCGTCAGPRVTAPRRQGPRPRPVAALWACMRKQPHTAWLAICAIQAGRHACFSALES